MAKVTKRQLERALDVLTAPAFQLQAAGLVAAEAEPLSPWTQEEGIQGFGIGRRITAGNQLGELVLKVYVEKKMPEAKLENPVPKSIDMPEIEATIETDVEAIGKVQLELETGRFRPARPGVGLGHLNTTVGTFGCLVRKRNDPNRFFVLSNAHVLADEGLGLAGDPILQAGVRDGGNLPADAYAQLTEWVPFQFTASDFPNTVDAAIAEVPRDQVSSLIRLIGAPPKGVSNRLQVGMKVKKVGRTTDLTFGEIKDVNHRLWMNLRKPGGGSGRVGLRDQVLCTRFTDGGDSGSAVLNSTGKIVGLHFAGSAAASIFNRITHVLEALDLDVVTEAF